MEAPGLHKRRSDARFRASLSSLLSSVAFFCAVGISPDAAVAQMSLDDAINAEIDDSCRRLTDNFNSDSMARLGDELMSLCGFGGPTGGGGVSAGGVATTSPSRGFLEDRLLSRREAPSEDGGVQTTRRLSFSDPTMSYRAIDRVRLFLTLGGESLEREDTAFTEGYEAEIHSITAGIEFEISPEATLGFAASRSENDGDFHSGGDYQADSIEPRLYAIFTPTPATFVAASIGRQKSDLKQTRRAVLGGDPTDPSDDVFLGDLSADYSTEKDAADILAGISGSRGAFAFDAFTGLSYAREVTDRYTETGSASLASGLTPGGPTGAEMTFEEARQYSLRSILGFGVSTRFTTGRNIIAPRVGLEWHHEFRDDRQDHQALFAQDNRDDPLVFDFSTDAPDRDWFVLSGTVAMEIGDRTQAFVSFRRLLGHDFRDSTAVIAGVRIATW